ncbi:MAG TPA: DUF3108 domain-containing protein [Anaeromyxobacter sp.]|nr:DUF3108 domain-containing protein [Anaeromyxobacter sp.]
MLAPVLALTLSAGPAALPLSAGPAALPFPPEERMDFAVHYLGLKVGRARISVGHLEGPILPVFLETRTAGIVKIVDVRQQLATHLDVETLLPRAASLDAHEAGYHHTDTAVFDRATGKATVREKGKFDNTYVIDVPGDALDFVALVFRLRALPLEPGVRHDFNVLAGRDVRKVTAEVTARERVETDAGTFSTVKVRVPTGFTGQFSEKRPTYVWFTDDERRVVVQIQTEFAIGRATAGLTGYQPGDVAVQRAPPAAPAQVSAPEPAGDASTPEGSRAGSAEAGSAEPGVPTASTASTAQ